MKIEMIAANGATITLQNPAVQSPDAAYDMTNRALELFAGLMKMDITKPLDSFMVEDEDE